MGRAVLCGNRLLQGLASNRQCRNGRWVFRTKRGEHAARLLKMIHQHDARSVFIGLRIKQVPAIGGNRQTLVQVAVTYEDGPRLPRREVIERNGAWKVLRDEVDTSGSQRPIPLKCDSRQLRYGPGFSSLPPQLQHHEA